MLANDQQYRTEQRTGKGFLIAKTIDQLKKINDQYVLLYLSANDSYPFYPDIDENQRHIQTNYWNKHDWFYFATQTTSVEALIAELKNNGITHIGAPVSPPYADQIKREPGTYPVFAYLNTRLEQLIARLPLVIHSDLIRIYQVDNSQSLH